MALRLVTRSSSENSLSLEGEGGGEGGNLLIPLHFISPHRGVTVFLDGH